MFSVCRSALPLRGLPDAGGACLMMRLPSRSRGKLDGFADAKTAGSLLALLCVILVTLGVSVSLDTNSVPASV